MDGYMLRRLMEERGNRGSNMMEKFKEFMRSERGGRRHFDDMDPWDYEYFSRRRDHEDADFRRMMESMEDSDKRRMWETMMESHEGRRGKHFSPSFAKIEVEEMSHTENGNKHRGEKYSMEKAEEVFRRYKSILPSEVTVADVYVAINCHFHDFAQLYKAWFGDNIDTKIIESAIVFWFKDEEFQDGEKLWKYFNYMK